MKRMILVLVGLLLLVGAERLAEAKLRDAARVPEPQPAAAPDGSLPGTALSFSPRASGKVASRDNAGDLNEARAADVAMQPQDAWLQVEPVKRPLISAIRTAGLSSREKRRAMLRALEESGVSAESWTAPAKQVFTGWHAQLPEELKAKVGLREIRCYQAGCAIEVEFDSESEYQQAASLFRQLREGANAHGGRVQTPLEPHPDGHGTASWIMLRPTEAQIEAAKGV